MALLLGLTPILIVVLWIVDGPRFHVPVSGAY